MLEKHIVLDDADPAVFYGVNNTHMQLLKALFPKLRIVARGNVLRVMGSDDDTARFEEVIRRLEKYCSEFNCLKEDVIVDVVNGQDPGGEKATDVILFGVTGRPILPRSVNQKKLVTDYAMHDMLFAIGPAGSGKTYTAIALAVRALKNKEVKRIVLCRPAVEAGEKLGFLPGTQLEKLTDSSLGNMLGAKFGDKYEINRLVSEHKLDILPMCDIRGYDTTGLKCAVYITEAQNLDISLMKLALQRIGEDSICIIDGDNAAQVDLAQYAGYNNGMRRLSEVFRGADFYGEVKLQNIYRGRIAKLADLM